MKIYALESDNENFENLINQISQLISIDLFDDFDELLDSVEEDCGGILLDFDKDTRKKDKLIAKCKKEFDGLNIFLLANSLDAKKMAKHQNSKTGAHLYFQVPMDDEVLKTMLESFFEFDESVGSLGPVSAEEVLAEHTNNFELSGKALETSEKIDQAFQSVGLAEIGGHAHSSIDDGGLSLGGMDHVEINQTPEEFSLESSNAEISLGDDLSNVPIDDSSMADINIEDSLEEISMGDDSSVDEMSLDDSPMDEMSLDGGDDDLMSLDDSPMEEMSLDDSPVEEMNLDQESVEEFSMEASDNEEKWEENDELSLGGGDEDDLPEKYPSDEDLTFPDFEAPAGLSEESPDEDVLSLSADEDEVRESGVGELDLGDSSMDFSLSDDNSSENEDVGSDDLGLSLDASEDTGEFNLSENTASQAGLTLNDQTSPSQVMDLADMDDDSQADLASLDSDDFDLGLSDESEEDEDDLSFGVDQPNDDASLSLSSDDEMNLAGDMNTGVDVLGGLDEELSFGNDLPSDDITRPTMSQKLNLDDLKPTKTTEDVATKTNVNYQNDFNVSVPNQYENPDAENIDDLLAGGSNAPEPIKEIGLAELDAGKSMDDVDSMTSTGLTIVGVSMSTQNRDDLAQHQDQLRANPEKTRVTEDHGPTSISINQELSRVDLPDELPDFSTTVAQKLNDIDSMMDEKIQGMHNASEADDKTLIAASSDEPTALHNRSVLMEEEMNEDATVVQRIPQEFYSQTTKEEEPTRVMSVSEDLKHEHREYVKTHDEELVRLGETIKSLREDREELLEKLHYLENKQDNHNENYLALKAQLDEKKIEIAVVKKRMEKQIDDLRFQLDITLDKKEFLAKQNEEFLAEIEKLSKQSKLDVNKVRYRERELEEKLEMLRKDAEIQIRNRDKKILELKRKIDTLEFDIESAQMKEKKSTSSQIDLEDRMNKVIKTLRGAIGQLEEDYGAEERKHKLKKNLDI